MATNTIVGLFISIGGFMEKLIELYTELIDCLEQQEGLDTKLVSFFPLKGKNYDGDLMVVGRAVNGWDTEWKQSELSDSNKRDQFVKNLISSYVSDSTCPLKWLEKSWNNNSGVGYDAKRSAFWRIVNKTITEFGTEQDWTSKIVWSNLYKVAPAKGGNPSGKLANLQKEIGVKILKEEIQLWKPKHILFLTGMNWARPFLLKIEEIEITNEQNGLVEATGLIKDGDYTGKVIIAKHPQGKRESLMIEEIKKNLIV